MKLVPAIDLIEGKCVRLTEGSYDTKKVYRDDPLEVAKEFEAVGITRLHMVDLDGAKKGSVVHQKTLERVAAGTNLTIDFGGGIKSLDAIQSVLDAGATYICVGSAAVKQKEEFFAWMTACGPQVFILGADVRG
ncbi:MAG: hypothetical protein KDD62_07605, partial [Bdellovibrionales bacterium]|nr:hypothetical protein [Bdellovibrionales bacterium]